MNKSLTIESIFTFIITALILVLFNPFNFWMPMAFHLVIIALLLVGFMILHYLSIKNSKEDEREQSLRLASYQLSYFVTTIVLMSVLIWQSFNHQVNIWIVGTLLLMMCLKYIGLFFYHRKG